MKTKPLVKEFIRFGVVGVLATALHYGIYYFLQSFINVNVAYTTGYVISFIVNFYLTSYFTFGTTPLFAIAIPVNFLFVRFVFKHKKL